MLLGIILVLIGLPLVIVYYAGGKKNVMWRNLGFIAIIFGFLIIATGGILYIVTG